MFKQHLLVQLQRPLSLFYLATGRTFINKLDVFIIKNITNICDKEKKSKKVIKFQAKKQHETNKF